MRMTHAIAIASLALVLSAQLPAQKAQQQLFADGSTRYAILVGEKASAGEREAAAVLADHLERISGATFPIVHEAGARNHLLFIGHEGRAAALGIPKPADEDDAFTIRSHGSALHFVGGARRGTLYAVYDFLEEELGCRWFASDATLIPKRRSFAFPAIDRREKPSLRWRSVDYIDWWNPKLAVPNKINAQFHGPQASPFIDLFWLEHSLGVLIPAHEFGRSHPEWFSLIDGQRRPEHSQLCLSNSALREVVVERLRRYVRDHPGYAVYNVAQNDNRHPCQCAGCRAVVAREGGESGLMIEFVNHVVARVKKEFPTKRFGTFAYQYTRRPPRHLKPDEDLVIVLCNIECDFSHPLSAPHNATFVEDLKRWQSLSDHLMIWDYVINYRHYFLPHPNFAVLKPNIRLFRDHGVEAVLEQANGQGRGSEFEALRGWVLAKLLWNPDADPQALVRTFMNGYYGASAPSLLRYFELVQKQVGPKTRISFATRLSNPIHGPRFYRQAEGLLDAALNAADDETIRRRVEVAGLGVLYHRMLRGPSPQLRRKARERLRRIVHREQIIWSSEGGRVRDLLKRLDERDARK